MSVFTGDRFPTELTITLDAMVLILNSRRHSRYNTQTLLPQLTNRANLGLSVYVGGVVAEALGDAEVDQLKVPLHEHEVRRLQVACVGKRKETLCQRVGLVSSTAEMYNISGTIQL
jgi:hypothetical protein